MDPTSLMALFGGAAPAAGALTPATGMAALLGNAGAGTLSPEMVAQLAANPDAALTLGGAGITSPNMTAQMAQNVPAEVANGASGAGQANPLEGIDVRQLAQLVGQPDSQNRAPSAPGVVGGRGVERADAFKPVGGGRRVSLAQLMGGR